MQEMAAGLAGGCGICEHSHHVWITAVPAPGRRPGLHFLVSSGGSCAGVYFQQGTAIPVSPQSCTDCYSVF